MPGLFFVLAFGQRLHLPVPPGLHYRRGVQPFQLSEVGGILGLSSSQGRWVLPGSLGSSL
jgi:hypothetical protein